MIEPERQIGLDQTNFTSYVETLNQKDKRIINFEKVDIQGAIVTYKVDVGLRHKTLSFNIALFESEELKIGIYHTLMVLPPNIDKGKIEQLNDWWKSETPESQFNIGETPDGLLVVALEDLAAKFQADKTGWISELVYTSAKVSRKAREVFSKPE